MIQGTKISPVTFDVTLWTDYDIHLFKEGNHFRLYEKLGAHCIKNGKKIEGIYFSVWAPNAREVSVIGGFNHWDGRAHKLGKRWDDSGIWEGFIAGLQPGTLYKYLIRSNFQDFTVEKQDPLAFYAEKPPCSASITWDMEYQWEDNEWMQKRAKSNAHQEPWSVYEVHLGSWRRVPEESNRWLTYREIAPLLTQHVLDLGFTHVELMPVSEHPFYGSWGYQCTGYFSPTSRYGTPQDFMYFVDYLHQHGIGVILDWVPSHFASDGHALHFFDGTHLYEHADPRKGYHPDWGSYIFNYGRNEVRAFLIGSAFFWLDQYHIDSLRIDAVASMLYLDYSRRNGDWVPNQYGGKENIESIEFLRRMNDEVYANFPGVQTIAEESTSFGLVSHPTSKHGLGFGFKWNMGWMHDSLEYFRKDAIYRKHHHHTLTFSMIYAFSENFVLSFSHDEVVHGKGSMVRKMSGRNDWEKFANLRLLYGYMFTHPGHKLMFMGGEFGQWNEWYHEVSLDWHLLDYPIHQQLMDWVRDLNHTYTSEPALYEQNFSPDGFYWIDFLDWQQSIVSFVRKTSDNKQLVLTVLNLTPIPRYDYQIGAPHDGLWKEILNSDAAEYGGSGHGNYGEVKAVHASCHGQPYSLFLTLPPLGMVSFSKKF
ncbi:MAG: 1,4-alpha-glucan branching protein GlgB [Verrucomicrobiota bacterium]